MANWSYRSLIILSWLTAAIGTVAIDVDVESILASGPLMLVMGTALIIWGGVRHHAAAAILGLGHVAVCGLVFLLIVLFSLGPQQAQTPCLLIACGYTALSLPLAVWAVRSAPPAAAARYPWECCKCGYLLFGIDGTTCPECGTAFDPRPIERARTAFQRTFGDRDPASMPAATERSHGPRG